MCCKFFLPVAEDETPGTTRDYYSATPGKHP